MKPGKTVEGVVRDMAHDGSAVVQTDSGVVLTTGGQKGERVRVRVGDKRKGARRGQLLELLEAAASRVPAFCPELARCGGCAWGEMSLDAQREQKRRWVAEAVGVDPERVATRFGGGEGYRRRVRWAWKERKGVVRIGYRPSRSRDVVDVSQCPVLLPELEQTLGTLRESLASDLRGTGEIEALASPEGVGIFVRSATPQTPGFYTACKTLAEGPLRGVVAQIEEVAPAVFGARCLALTVQANGRSVCVHTPIGGFAQGNAELNDALVSCVLQGCPSDAQTVIDLFSGSGNIALALATLAPKKMWMVESNRAALEACRETWRLTDLATAKNTSAKFLALEAEQAAGKLPSKADVLVLDPPREGAGVALMRELVALKPERIIYVSCNPPTLGRDLAALDGYQVQSATMVDMFPQTPHVESVTVLVRRDVAGRWRG